MKGLFFASLRRRFGLGKHRFGPILLTVMVLVWDAPLGLAGQAGAGKPACGGNSTVDVLGAKTAASARAFLTQLQAAVRANQREQVAGMIGYPLLVLEAGKRTRIRQRQAFVANYERIVIPSVRDAILHQTAECLFGNSNGAMIGNGEVWFREQAADEWKIITINESAQP